MAARTQNLLEQLHTEKVITWTTVYISVSSGVLFECSPRKSFPSDEAK